jgi:DNA-binding IclR family transcriptional regulator
MTTSQTITELVLSKLRNREVPAGTIARDLAYPIAVVRRELNTLVRQGLALRTLPPSGSTKASRYRIAPLPHPPTPGP